MEDLTNQFVAGGVVVYLLQYFKSYLASIGIVKQSITKIARILAALGAALAVVGIGYAFDPQAGVLTISGLTVTSITTALWEWIKQYVIQQAMWRGYKVSKNGDFSA